MIALYEVLGGLMVAGTTLPRRGPDLGAVVRSRSSAVNPYTIRHVRIGFAFVQHM